MQYAVPIAVLVVLIAILPSVLRGWRDKRRSGDGGSDDCGGSDGGGASAD